MNSKQILVLEVRTCAHTNNVINLLVRLYPSRPIVSFRDYDWELNTILIWSLCRNSVGSVGNFHCTRVHYCVHQIFAVNVMRDVPVLSREDVLWESRGRKFGLFIGEKKSRGWSNEKKKVCKIRFHLSRRYTISVKSSPKTIARVRSRRAKVRHDSFLV